MKKDEDKDEDYIFEGVRKIFEKPKDYFPLFTAIKKRVSGFINNLYHKAISLLGEDILFYIQSSIYNIFRFLTHHVVTHLRGIATTSAVIAGLAVVIVNPGNLLIYAAFQVSALIIDTVIAYKRQVDLKKLETNLKYSQYFSEAAAIEKKICEKNYQFGKSYGYVAKKNNEKTKQQFTNDNINKRAAKRGFINKASSILLLAYDISKVLSISGAVFLLFSFLEVGYSKNIGILRKYYVNKIRDAQDDYPDHLKYTKDPKIIKELAFEKILSVKTMIKFAEKTQNKELTEAKKNFLLHESFQEAKSELEKHPDFKDTFKKKSIFQNISTALNDYAKANNPFDTSLSIEELIERSKSLTTTVIEIDTSKKKPSHTAKKTPAKTIVQRQTNTESQKDISNDVALDNPKESILEIPISRTKEKRKADKEDHVTKRVVDLMRLEHADASTKDTIISMDNFSKLEQQSSKSKGK